MRKLSTRELDRISADKVNTIRKMPLVVVLDNIRSGLNVGSVFRTCDAFAVSHIFITGFTPQPPHREILKTALGSTETVSWTYVESTEDCLKLLEKEGFYNIAIEQTTESISLEKFVFHHDRKYALILGNEVDGVSDEAIAIADAAIEIPQAGVKHSLNVAVCGGMVLWEAFRQLYLP
ncbi:MAG TPA: TrmH family RNA methyltransferase [Saprospiraceae bacterium]|nr:TrmH family RNA methyltransferase [Saprospiraceae bacterium]